MIIGGLQKFSLLDYPGHLAAIVFTQGCNFRCQFCYNPMLVRPKEVGKLPNKASQGSGEAVKEGHPPMKEGDLFDFLKERTGKLDAVVITGGEPTIHSDLEEFIAKIRDLGFKIKLDTNGTSPESLKSLIRKRILDYIAMDLKTGFKKYDLVAGVQPDLKKISESIIIIKESGLHHEFRTTVVPELVDLADIEDIGKKIKGADKWFLQKFVSDTELVNRSFEIAKAYSSDQMEKMRAEAAKYVKECEIR